MEATGASPKVPGNLSLEQFQVYLERQGGTSTPMRRWGTGVRPQDILAPCLDRTLRKAKFDNAAPFSDVKASVVTEMLTELKVQHGWSKDVRLDGPHVFRHSTAA